MAELTKLEGQLQQGSGRQAHKELVWVWHDIRSVLERERGVMREQVGRATGQVREWVVREQRGQLLQQARQLQEEAEIDRGDGPAGPGSPASASNVDDDAPASKPPMGGGVSAVNAATTTGSEGADGLLGRLDALAESHWVLGREYEASLRILREACTELRNSQEQLRKQAEEQPKQQREQMEPASENRGQMKERVEMLRKRVEEGLRAEVEAELTAKLSSEMQERPKAERTKLEEQIRQGSGLRAHEELVWVWHDIRRVLERERGMVREQLGRATG